LEKSYRVPRTTRCVVAPHGNYLSYPSGLPREIARRELNVPIDAFVYLSFGLIRAYKGFDDLLAAFRRVRLPNKWLIVAGEYDSGTTNAWRQKLMLARTTRLSRRVRFFLRTVPSAQVQTFVNASDCVVLSHRQGLNSGVAILAMTFGKPVVGPNLGCIEWVLRAGRNLVFKAGDRDSLVECMEAAATLDLPSVDAANRAIANGWTWKGMAQAVLEEL
jgi:glycosyltransferase involved in cell wall biosynthesis